MSYLDGALAKLKGFENSVSWMYQDTAGLVTVGVGLMLPHVDDAVALPFVIGGRPATLLEKSADFLRVAQLPKGRVFRGYWSETSPILPQAVIDQKLREIVVSRDSDLHRLVKGYDSLPDAWKMALLDMAYNLGTHGLVDGFPHLIQAVEARNWQAASAQSNRHGIGMPRNDWTRECFEVRP